MTTIMGDEWWGLERERERERERDRMVMVSGYQTNHKGGLNDLERLS